MESTKHQLNTYNRYKYHIPASQNGETTHYTYPFGHPLSITSTPLDSLKVTKPKPRCLETIEVEDKFPTLLGEGNNAVQQPLGHEYQAWHLNQHFSPMKDII